LERDYTTQLLAAAPGPGPGTQAMPPAPRSPGSPQPQPKPRVSHRSTPASANPLPAAPREEKGGGYSPAMPQLWVPAASRTERRRNQNPRQSALPNGSGEKRPHLRLSAATAAGSRPAAGHGCASGERGRSSPLSPGRGDKDYGRERELKKKEKKKESYEEGSSKCSAGDSRHGVTNPAPRRARNRCRTPLK